MVRVRKHMSDVRPRLQVSPFVGPGLVAKQRSVGPVDVIASDVQHAQLLVWS